MHRLIGKGSLSRQRIGKVLVSSLCSTHLLGVFLLLASCLFSRPYSAPPIPSQDLLKEAREVLRKKGYWDALPSFWRAISAEPDRYQRDLLRYELAMAAIEAGERDIALDLLAVILEHDPSHPLALPLYQSLREPVHLPPPMERGGETPSLVRVLITDPEGFTIETTADLVDEKGVAIHSGYRGTLKDLFPYPVTQLTRIGGEPFPATLNGYRTIVRLFHHSEGVIIELPLEDYLLGVLAREMGAGFPLEALKAQAVLSRTFLYELALRSPLNAPYHVRGDTSHQAFRIGAISPEMITAVVSTRGEILTFEGAPAVVFFHADNGGISEDPRYVWGFSFPYYRIQRDPFSNQVPPWRLVLSPEELGRVFRFANLRTLELFRSPSGRVMEVVLKGGNRVVRLKGNEFRLTLGSTRLKSLKFRLAKEGRELVFFGEGYGHGVGLSQWGAKRMAEAGLGYKEILSFYYPGTVLLRLPPEGAVSQVRGR